tara:strand:- start:3244 stop:4518 length:1275 start_codon:yes stop_codon:yes gene_type:complete
MILLLILSHLLLAILMQTNPLFISVHAYLISIFGIYYILTDSSSDRGLIFSGYIIGSELLWRGFGANVFWEYGKILGIVCILLIIFRLNLRKIKLSLGTIYIFLLLPSLIILETYNRSDISHALLGPIFLGLSVTLYKNINIDRTLFLNILLFTLVPIMSLLIITNYNTLFSGGFNYSSAYLDRIETAGIGPNQASNILGLGALLSFLLIQFLNNKWMPFFQLVGIVAIIQTILTHSRGGFWNTLFSIVVFYFFQLTTGKSRLRLVAGVLPAFLSFYFLIFPFLDDISGGSVVSRFTDTDLSSREDIVNSELIAYQENPFFGIGPGQSRKFRLENFNNYKHAHTEYTRLLAEHGIFGIFTLGILGVLILSTIVRKKGINRSISMTLITWSLLFMTHSATRLAAPSLIFGLAMANFNLEVKREDK